MDAFFYLVGYVFFCAIAGAIASRKGRRAVTYFLLSMLLTPLIGILLALVARPDTQKVEQEKIASGQGRKCPFCAEVVKAEATICRFCAKELPAPVQPPPPGEPKFRTRAEYETWKAKEGKAE